MDQAPTPNTKPIVYQTMNARRNNFEQAKFRFASIQKINTHNLYNLLYFFIVWKIGKKLYMHKYTNKQKIRLLLDYDLVIGHKNKIL